MGAEKVLKNGIMEAVGKASKISDATLCFKGKRDSNGKSKFWDRSIRTTTKHVDGARFVAFGADYHGSKRHPRKHNDASNMRFQEEANTYQIDLNKLETKTLISIGTRPDMPKASLDGPPKGHNQVDKGIKEKGFFLW